MIDALRLWLAFRIVPTGFRVTSTLVLESERGQYEALIWAKDEAREKWQDIASRHQRGELEMKQQNIDLQERLAYITELITRRPPRRRWLALSRRIAKLALVVDSPEKAA